MQPYGSTSRVMHDVHKIDRLRTCDTCTQNIAKVGRPDATLDQKGTEPAEGGILTRAP